ncbi:MAG: LPXTG cell wall anchor domain-containing protein, partial [Clostridiales bacterium]|nr:LPXTG cell wall anchor domain-containing protein [Clostridiales bacterium]
TTPTTPTPTTPATGDSTPLAMWGVLLVLSAGGLLAVYFKRRETKK